MELKERYERMKKSFDINRNQVQYFNEELFRNIHFFLKHIEENQAHRYPLKEEEIYYNNHLTNIKYESRKKEFIKNAQAIFTFTLNKKFTIKREFACTLAKRNHNNFLIISNNIIEKIKHYSTENNPLFFEYEIIYNLIKILENEGAVTSAEIGETCNEGKFIIYGLDEQLKNKELINFKYINIVSELFKTDITMKEISKKFDQEFFNYEQKYLFDTLYFNLDSIYSKIKFRSQIRSSFLHIVTKFKALVMLYKYSDYLNLITKKEENQNSRIENILKKEFNMFCLNADFFTLAEVELGNGRLDALLNEISSNNIIIYEAKQIGFKEEELNSTIVKKSIKDAKKQIDNYFSKLQSYPKIKPEGHIIIFTGKDFKLEQDTFTINNYSYIIHIIPIIEPTPSTQDPVLMFSISEIFSSSF